MLPLSMAKTGAAVPIRKIAGEPAPFVTEPPPATPPAGNVLRAGMTFLLFRKGCRPEEEQRRVLSVPGARI